MSKDKSPVVVISERIVYPHEPLPSTYWPNGGTSVPSLHMAVAWDGTYPILPIIIDNGTAPIMRKDD